MITRQKQLWYFVGDKPFASLEEAQKVDLEALMPDWQEVAGAPFKKDIAAWLIKNKEAIVDTLTTTPRSRLRARKSHGATRKPRKPKPVPTA